MTRTVSLFLALTFGAIVAMVAAVLGTGAPTDVLGVLTPIGQLVPAAAAVLAWAVFRPARLIELLALRLPRRAWATIGWATLAVLGITAAQVGLGLALGATTLRADPLWLNAPLVLVIALATLPLCLGEEVGWRGLLLGAWRRPLGPWGSALAVGAVWSVWHVPLLAAYAVRGDVPWREVLAASINMLLASLLLAATRWASTSSVPAGWAHALLNASGQFATGSLISSTRDLDDTRYWLWAAIGWALWTLVGGLWLARGIRGPRGAR